MLEPLLDAVSIGGNPGRPRGRFEAVPGDKGYDSQAAREAIMTRGSAPLIPHRKLADGSYPPGSEGFDRIQYKRRNLVQRLIGRIKECRRVATRYDKLAESFRAFVLLALIRTWLNDLLLDRTWDYERIPVMPNGKASALWVTPGWRAKRNVADRAPPSRRSGSSGVWWRD